MKGVVKVTVDECKSIWKNHMEKLMNEDNKYGDCVDNAKAQGPVSMIQLEEVETALKYMNSVKVSGPTSVVVEMLRAEGKLCLASLTKIFKIFRCCFYSLVPIYNKKGDP